MYKRRSWIHPGIESHGASFSAFSTGALCSFPMWTVRFLLSPHKDVLQVVKWPLCQETGDLTGLSGRAVLSQALPSDFQGSPCSSDTQGQSAARMKQLPVLSQQESGSEPWPAQSGWEAWET